MLDLDRGGTRATFIAALLGAVFLLTLFLALRAQMAWTYHRVAAQRVVHDWSAVAADELLRRIDNQIGYYGVYPALQAISSEPSLPDRTRLAVHTFRCTSDGRIEVSPGTPPSIRDWLAQHFRAGDGKPIVATIDGREHVFVYLVAQQTAVGMELDRSAIAAFIPQALERPLLPKSLADGRITNDAIQLRVRDADGREVFHAGGPFTPSTRREADAGVLHGFVVETAVAPRFAPLLVFGGVPRSPLPMYIAVLALTALLLITAALQVRRERALARMRSEFVASVSHELRTPLTQIRMFAETLMLDRVRSEEERTRALAVIDQETRRLSNVVENVLQFSRGERGTLRVVRHPCDVASVARETIALFAPIAARQNVNVVLEADEPIEANVDESAVRQIVLNLLDNAVKYGPAGQTVTVRIEDHRIIVDDEGPGIPPRERRRVWSRYYRLPRESERAIAGAGIGLSVVRELAALHGGRARIEESPRGGARVIVELPA
ncbi:MAG TPA: HAMP domain-containing sensor histidine kinase [Thermoanaerobaculia bacterium]|nr:HAMP domain-containing sensor histidine kinase [Thermoanaerobaculia bacterium]